MSLPRATFDAMNPFDIILGVARAIHILLSGRRNLGEEQYYAPASHRAAEGQNFSRMGYVSESGVEGTTYGASGLASQSPPPPTYAALGWNTNKSQLVAAPRDARTPSPRRY